jgi:YesN/AraC family two-component response regulator
MLSFGEIEFLQDVPEDKLKLFNKNIEESGIEIIKNQIVILVQKLKDAIIDMVFNDQNTINLKSSVYLSDKLGDRYNYLSDLFSEVSYTSIQNFIILQKIEYTKSLNTKSALSLTEIASMLSYSSMAHLSTQFKKHNGDYPDSISENHN